MSLESARAFVESTHEDADLREQVVAAASGEQLRAIGEARGFLFTDHELGLAACELAPDQLDQVIGGNTDASADAIANILFGSLEQTEV